MNGVWKKFRRGPRHDSLRELIPAVARGLARPRSGALRGEEFWALRDVSFEVLPGEALGIIGPNGAGKSTILRLLTRLLAADRGRVEVRGRVGALIELAAGFHPDLTGRENVFLQGAIMGMRRTEIAQKFDDIVEFAGVSTFIDTPVKRYSSGMNARLGFAIAAHLDPEVLLVDEVLSVGDLAFQRRAMERLAAIVQREVPVVLISHRLNRVLELCPRALLLVDGAVAHAGPTAECINAYIEGAALDSVPAAPPPVRLDALGEPIPSRVQPGERTVFRLRGAILDSATVTESAVGIQVRALPDERLVFATHTAACGVALPATGAFELEIDVAVNLGPGAYRALGLVWHREERREWARGPSTLFQVERAATSLGPVFVAPRMRLVSP